MLNSNTEQPLSRNPRNYDRATKTYGPDGRKIDRRSQETSIGSEEENGGRIRTLTLLDLFLHASIYIYV